MSFTYLFLFSLAVVEFLYFMLKKIPYPYAEVASALFTSTINSKIYSLSFQFLFLDFYEYIFSQRLFVFNLDKVPKYILTFFIMDLGFYWIHRACHSIRFSWTAHEVHHYPNRLTILNATSQSLLGMILNVHIPIFCALAFFGFEPKVFLSCFGINLLYQLCLHTDYIPRLGWAEKIFNTPNLHRIHHSLSKDHVGKNFSGVFIVFDRIFNTYYDDKSFFRSEYGTVPVYIATSIFSTWSREILSWKNLIYDIRDAPTIKEKLHVLYKV